MRAPLPVLLLAALFWPTCGCLRPGESNRVWYVGAVAPPSPSRVAECRSEQASHAAWTFAGVSFGALAGAGATVAPLAKDDGLKVGLAVEGAVAGLLAAASGGLASLEASLYAADDCQSVLSAAP